MRILPITPSSSPAYKKPRYGVAVNFNKVELVNIDTGQRKDFKGDAFAACDMKVRLSV